MCSQKFSVARWAALCINNCLKPHGVIFRHSPNCTRFLCGPPFAHPQRDIGQRLLTAPSVRTRHGGEGSQKGEKSGRNRPQAANFTNEKHKIGCMRDWQERIPVPGGGGGEEHAQEVENERFLSDFRAHAVKTPKGDLF